MQAGRAAPSSAEPASQRTYRHSKFATAALGALISSFIVVFALGAVMTALPSTRLLAALCWLGAWAVDFLLTLPITWLMTKVYRRGMGHPRFELLVVSLIGLVPAAFFGFIVLAIPGSGNIYE